MTYAILAEGSDEKQLAALDRALEGFPSRSANYIVHTAAAPAVSDPDVPPPPRPAANLDGAKALIAAMNLPTK